MRSPGTVRLSLAPPARAGEPYQGRCVAKTYNKDFTETIKPQATVPDYQIPFVPIIDPAIKKHNELRPVKARQRRIRSAKDFLE